MQQIYIKKPHKKKKKESEPDSKFQPRTKREEHTSWRRQDLAYQALHVGQSKTAGNQSTEQELETNKVK